MMIRFGTLGFSPALDCTLTLDLLPFPNAISRCIEESVVIGGKSINVARMLARNNKPVTAAAIVGQDAVDLYTQECIAAGIEPALTAVLHPTRRNLTLLGEGGESKINRPAFPGLQSDPMLIDTLLSQLKGLDVVVLSGSLPPRFAPDVVTHVIHTLKASGCCIAVDTTGSALYAAVNAGADIISPNRLEFSEITGTETMGPEQLREWVDASACQLLILSDGPSGAWFATRSECIHVPSPDVIVRDTTGAGDALLAQFLCDYFPSRIVTRSVAARAVAAGAAACEIVGPQCPDPSRIAALSM